MDGLLMAEAGQEVLSLMLGNWAVGRALQETHIGFKSESAFGNLPSQTAMRPSQYW